MASWSVHGCWQVSRREGVGGRAGAALTNACALAWRMPPTRPTHCTGPLLRPCFSAKPKANALRPHHPSQEPRPNALPGLPSSPPAPRLAAAESGLLSWAGAGSAVAVSGARVAHTRITRFQLRPCTSTSCISAGAGAWEWVGAPLCANCRCGCHQGQPHCAGAGAGAVGGWGRGAVGWPWGVPIEAGSEMRSERAPCAAPPPASPP